MSMKKSWHRTIFTISTSLCLALAFGCREREESPLDATEEHCIKAAARDLAAAGRLLNSDKEDSAAFFKGVDRAPGSPGVANRAEARLRRPGVRAYERLEFLNRVSMDR